MIRAFLNKRWIHNLRKFFAKMAKKRRKFPQELHVEPGLISHPCECHLVGDTGNTTIWRACKETIRITWEHYDARVEHRCALIATDCSNLRHLESSGWQRSPTIHGDGYVLIELIPQE